MGANGREALMRARTEREALRYEVVALAERRGLPRNSAPLFEAERRLQALTRRLGYFNIKRRYGTRLRKTYGVADLALLLPAVAKTGMKRCGYGPTLRNRMGACMMTTNS